jgi:hypothetical protein
VVSYATTTANAGPTLIADGADGSLWFVESTAANYASITTAGAVTEVGTGSPSNIVRGVSAGVAGTTSAGLTWVSIGDVDLGSLMAFNGIAASPTYNMRVGPDPGPLAADSQGHLWVALAGSADTLDEASSPYANGDFTPISLGARPLSLAAGGDGTTIWVTEEMPGTSPVYEIASIVNGTPTQFPLPNGITGTLGQIVLGPDGNMYAGLEGSDGSQSYVLQISPSGTINPIALPATSTANPDVLAVGPDKLIWMEGAGQLTSMTTSGTFATYSTTLPPADTIGGIAPDPSADALWLTDTTDSMIYDVALAPPPAPPLPPAPPPTLTATVQPAAGLTKTTAQLTGAIAEPAGSASSSVSYFFDYGTTTAYGETTPTQTATVTPSGLTVSALLSPLVPFTTYHYRLVASDCSTASCQSASADQSFTTGTTLQPVENTDVGVTPVAGTIRVKLPGHRHFARLPIGALIPIGATVDARHGTVLIESAIGGGEVASGQFRGGIFTIAQPAGQTFTILRLDSKFTQCRPARASAVAASVRKRKPRPASKKVVNQVFGNAHGQFETRGQYATAADQGTAWRTADRCDGTQIAVSVGIVTVTNLVTHRTFVLAAPDHYLARPR